MRVRNKYYLELSHSPFPEREPEEEEQEPEEEQQTDSGDENECRPETFREALTTEQPVLEVDAHHMRPVASADEGWDHIRPPPCRVSRPTVSRQHVEAVNQFLDYYNDSMYCTYARIQEALHDAGLAQARPCYAGFIDAVAGALRFQQVVHDAGDEDGVDAYGVDDAPGIKHPEISYT